MDRGTVLGTFCWPPTQGKRRAGGTRFDGSAYSTTRGPPPGPLGARTASSTTPAPTRRAGRWLPLLNRSMLNRALTPGSPARFSNRAFESGYTTRVGGHPVPRQPGSRQGAGLSFRGGSWTQVGAETGGSGSAPRCAWPIWSRGGTGTCVGQPGRPNYRRHGRPRGGSTSRRIWRVGFWLRARVHSGERPLRRAGRPIGGRGRPAARARLVGVGGRPATVRVTGVGPSSKRRVRRSNDGRGASNPRFQRPRQPGARVLRTDGLAQNRRPTKLGVTPEGRWSVFGGGGTPAVLLSSNGTGLVREPRQRGFVGGGRARWPFFAASDVAIAKARLFAAKALELRSSRFSKQAWRGPFADRRSPERRGVTCRTRLAGVGPAPETGRLGLEPGRSRSNGASCQATGHGTYAFGAPKRWALSEWMPCIRVRSGISAYWISNDLWPAHHPLVVRGPESRARWPRAWQRAARGDQPTGGGGDRSGPSSRGS